MQTKTNAPLTFILIAVNAIVHFLSMQNPQIIHDYGLIPSLVEAEPVRLFTSMFLHSGMMHIALNMLSIWFIGRALEDRIGTIQYSLLYFLGGLGGSFLVWKLSDPHSITVGASGAVFALMGALLVYSLRDKANLMNTLVFIGLNTYMSFTNPGISWQGHMGGLFAGFFVGGVLYMAENSSITRKQGAQRVQKRPRDISLGNQNQQNRYPDNHYRGDR